MGTFASIVTDKFGDTNRTEADEAAGKAFSKILDHLSDMLDNEAGDSPFKRRIVAEGLLAQIENGAGIFTQSGSATPKEVAAAPASTAKDDIDPYTPQNDNERNAVDAVRYHGLVIDDEGEPEQVVKLRQEIIDLKGLLDDVDEALVGSSTLPTDTNLDKRKARMTKAVTELKGQSAKDQEDITDTFADAISERHREARESLDKYQQRVDGALKAKLAAAGSTKGTDLKPIADALGKPADSSVDELAADAAKAHDWRVQGTKMATTVLGTQPGADEKPGEILNKVDRTLRAIKPGRQSGNSGTNPNAGNNR